MGALRLHEVSTLLLQAFGDFFRVWTRFLATDLFYKVVAFVVLAPLAGLILNLFVATSGSAVIADEDILFFLLRPVGLIGLVVIGAVALCIAALEQACLMAIGYGEMNNRSVEALDGIRFGMRSAKRVFLLTFHIVVRTVLIAAPFLIVMGLLYLQLLTEFDINYYLTERPPEFKFALVLAGLLVAVLAVLVIRRLLSWSFALPLLLFEGKTPKNALGESPERVQGHRLLVTLVLVGWGVAVVILSGLPVGMVELLGGWIVPKVRGSMTGVTAAAGALLLLFSVANLVVTALNASTFALLVLRLWQRFGMAEDLLDPDEIRSKLEPQRRFRWSRTGVIAVLVAAIAVAGVVGYLAIERVVLEDDVTITAHRGAAAHAPENTLASVERGLEDGADYIEIDVQEDADGRVVVLHDSDLMKIGGSQLKIWDATADQLASVDIGSWFAPEFSDQRVPTLEEVLELCRGRAMVNIELKYYGHNLRLEEKVAEIVENLGMAPDVIVMSLKYEMVQKMKSIRPEWTVGLLTAKAVGDLTKLEADFLAVNSGMAKGRFVRSAHAAGKDVFVWTINDPLGMSVMMSRGVDSIITDDPALAHKVIAWREDLNPAERAILALAYWFGITPPAADVATDIG
jgi:glycerophosphoryl diester phosphodiesterase